jgi:predicted metalloprotease
MRWTPGDRSNIEDRRGSAVRGAMPLGIGGLVVLLALSWFTGIDFLSLMDGGAPQTQV